MATIMEGAKWNVSEAAAERMVQNGLIQKCLNTHSDENVDQPVYHIARGAPRWFGVHSLLDAIISAEAHVEVNDAEGTVVPATQMPS